MSSLMLVCTYKHELILFHNALTINLSSLNHEYFLAMFLFNYQIISFHNIIDEDPLPAT
jgi:hypothetical protein